MCLITGRAYAGVPTTALRFFNVYGPRQALSNPYTGVLAIFASRLLNEQPPLVFEDGAQRRDFVHVRDVARACRIAVETDAGAGMSINIASGISISIGEIAERLIAALSRRHSAARHRAVPRRRHPALLANVSLAAEVLDFRARVPFEDGLRELVGWLAGCAATDPKRGGSRGARAPRAHVA